MCSAATLSNIGFSSVSDTNSDNSQITDTKKIVIAIDGPSASGKGTLAKMIAERLGYAHLDTGTLYRAVGLATLEMEGDPSNIDDVRPAIGIIKRNLTEELLANPAIRRKEVADAASKVSALPEVRKNLLDYQQEFAKNPPGNVGGAVLDGRDTGTVVCPDADVKFFVDADVDERARRRFKDLERFHTDLTQEQVLADLKERDARDRNRPISPAKPAEDAYIIDMTTKTPEEGVEEMISVIMGKILSKVEF